MATCIINVCEWKKLVYLYSEAPNLKHIISDKKYKCLFYSGVIVNKTYKTQAAVVQR